MLAHWRARLAHAWGAPDPDAGAPTTPGQSPAHIADAIRRHGLALPAEVAAEAHRPLMFMYAQLAYVAAPVLDALLPGRRAAQLAAALEDPRALDALLARLRTPEAHAPHVAAPKAPGRR